MPSTTTRSGSRKTRSSLGKVSSNRSLGRKLKATSPVKKKKQKRKQFATTPVEHEIVRKSSVEFILVYHCTVFVLRNHSICDFVTEKTAQFSNTGKKHESNGAVLTIFVARGFSLCGLLS